MSEEELDQLALVFAEKNTPKNSYSVNKWDLKFGFKEGAKFILKMVENKEREEALAYCEHQED